MSRFNRIKSEWPRILLGLLLTASLPFMADWHNPNGVQPLVLFGFLAAMFWVGFIFMMIVPEDES